MIKHIILWNLKDEYSDSQKLEIKKGIKQGLESLQDKIPGLVDIHVNLESLDSSTCDVMLDSTFETVDALKNYSVNPLHVEVADNFVRPYIKNRTAYDYEDMKLYKDLY